MTNTRKVLLSLHLAVAEKLDAEPNKSLVVDSVLAAYYGLNFEGKTPTQKKRQKLVNEINGNGSHVQSVNAPRSDSGLHGGAMPIVEPFVSTAQTEPSSMHTDGRASYPCLSCGKRSWQTLCEEHRVAT